jgi:integrase
MACTKGSRGWGHIRRLPSGRFQASYVHNVTRYNAPRTFPTKLRAEGWLADERRLIDLDTWTSPAERAAAHTARVMALAEYAVTWIEQRPLKPRTRAMYSSLLRLQISDTIGKVPVAGLSAEAVRAWYAKLGTEHIRRNSHVYALLHAVCETAVKDALLQANPCRIERAMNPPRRREPVILDVPEVAKLADAIEPQRFRALVLLSAWCGLRFGEVIELRRRDIDPLIEVITVSRAVTRSDGVMRVDTPKSGKGRTVVIPPHIRADIKHHLDVFTAADADALLFPNGAGGHLNDTVFRRGSFRPALKSIGRDGVRVHDLRHFQGTQVARVGNLAESMARLGHSTVRASLIYQSVVSGRDAEIAAALSMLAAGG